MPTPNRVSLKDIAEDDEPIQRTDLMAPTIAPAQETPAPIPVAAPTPIAPPAPKAQRAVRQGREVATQQTGSDVVIRFANDTFGRQQERDQISAWVWRWVNEGIDKAERDAKAQGHKKITRSMIIQQAIIEYLHLTPPAEE